VWPRRVTKCILTVSAEFALKSGSNFSRSGTQKQVMGSAALASEPSLVALMQAAEGGSKMAADALFSALYSELRRLAKRELARHGAPISLSATTLLHKAYIEIADRDGTSFPDRNRFMGYAARVMRGLVIDHARSRCAQKRGVNSKLRRSGAKSKMRQMTRNFLVLETRWTNWRRRTCASRNC
jgi:hypothetical protein